MKRILLTGINGQVGRELQRTLQPLGEVIACDRNALDLARSDTLIETVLRFRPDIIVNPAAYTTVDKAETDTALAMCINGQAPGLLAEAARSLDALLVHFSTDYVFDGSQTRPYREDDPTHPLGQYGISKLAGEHAIQASGCRYLILRTSWVYGRHGQNFMNTMFRLASTHDELRVVADQTGAPTWSRMLAETTSSLLARHEGQHGVYHCAAAGTTTWHGFAEAIFALAQQTGLVSHKPIVRAITTADYPTPVRRPANSTLDCSKLERDFGLRQPGWKTQLQLCLT